LFLSHEVQRLDEGSDKVSNKPQRPRKTESATPIILKCIVVERRLERLSDSEIWIVDGNAKDSSGVGGAGTIVVLYRKEPLPPFIWGSLGSQYDLEAKEDEVYKMLSKSLSWFMGIEAAECFFTWKSGTVDCSWE